MTHDELLALLNAKSDSDEVHALRAVVEYAKELSKTDYRGNPPVEHYISAKLIQIIEKELV